MGSNILDEISGDVIATQILRAGRNQYSNNSWCYRKRNPKRKLLNSRTYNNDILDYLSKDYDIMCVKINDDWEESFSNSNSLSIELPMKIIARRKD